MAIALSDSTKGSDSGETRGQAVKRIGTSIGQIVGILAAVMIVIFAAWEGAERIFLDGASSTTFTIFNMVRGISTGVVMSALAVALMLRYRKRFEELLRQQSEAADRTRVFFQNIVQDAGDAIISLDKDGIIRSWNQSAEEIYGYEAEEMIGHTVERLTPPDLLAAGEPVKLAQDVLRKGYIRNYETRRLRKDGSMINVRITRSLLRDAQGNMIGSSAIVSDITAQKQIESRLIQAEKMAAIGQAAAGIAHEVRNALAGISGVVQVLKGSQAWKELPDGFSEEVDLQVGRIAQIVNDLLTYARPGTLNAQKTNLHDVLERALKAASTGPDASHKKVERTYAAGNLSAEVDAGRLEQAFTNLANNAFQAMDPGGVLKVSTEQDNGILRISFEDTGRGMPPEVQGRAFEAFFTTKVRGTGLGLPIVRNIVEAHKGTVVVQSDGRKGTKVTLTLPATPLHQRVGETIHAKS